MSVVIKRRLKRALWALVVCALLLAGVRAFVGDVYPVASSSMEPALYPGERVWLEYDRSVPRRFEVVVLKGPSGEHLVKRAVGLPGEEFLITPDGDVRIGQTLLSPEVSRPAPVAVFDDRLHAVADHFHHGGTTVDPWREVEPDVWELDGRELPRGSAAGLLRLARPLHDDRLAADGKIVYGVYPVGDAIVECECLVVEPAGELRLELLEAGDTFECSIDLSHPEAALATLTRRHHPQLGVDESTAAVTELAQTTTRIATGAWTRLRFSNVDNYLSVELDGHELLTCSYAKNTPGKSIGERVALGGTGGVLRFRAIRVLRDRHYTARGRYGVQTLQVLGPDEIFVLGDNSADSFDSREFGPVKLSSLLGRPTCVVWPLGRARSLEPR